mgnify:CR=1 FL=1
MIRSFKHKGLQAYFATGNKKGIQAKHSKRLKMLLYAVDTATEIGDVDLPGFRLHQLSGTRSNIWSVRVSGNWGMTFEYKNGHAYILDYEDYH